VPVFSAGGKKPAGWRDEVLVEDLKRGWHMLRTLEWTNGERELYEMRNDSFQLQSLHEDPGRADLVALLYSRLQMLKKCSGNSCRTLEKV